MSAIARALKKSASIAAIAPCTATVAGTFAARVATKTSSRARTTSCDTHQETARVENQNVVKVLDRGKWVEQKICVICERPFTYRKKWERCWDEVTTCSKRCNSERRRQNRRARKCSEKVEMQKQNTAPAGVQVQMTDNRPARRARKKLLKAQKRAKRECRADPSVGRKECTTCSMSSDFLIRCRIDETKSWHLICGKCWKKFSGGVPDGDAAHPMYQYGGLWKNLHKV